MFDRLTGLEPITKPLSRKYFFALLLGAVLLLGWVFSGYFAPEILIDFVMRYCA